MGRPDEDAVAEPLPKDEMPDKAVRGEDKASDHAPTWVSLRD